MYLLSAYESHPVYTYETTISCCSLQLTLFQKKNTWQGLRILKYVDNPDHAPRCHVVVDSVTMQQFTRFIGISFRKMHVTR